MDLRHLYLENFKATDSAEYDFRQPGLTLVCGPNGAGKTTIADAISFALRNRSISGKRPKDLLSTIHDGPLLVELEFDINQATYLIRRHVSRKGAMSVEVFENKTKKEFPTSNKANEFIANLCSTSLFFNAVFFSRSAGSFFIQLSEPQKKKFLEELLGLEIYEEAEAIVKEQLSDLEKQLSVVERDESVFASSSERRKAELSETIQSLSTKLSTLAESKSQLQEQLQTLEQWLKAAEPAEGRLKTLKTDEEAQRLAYQKSSAALDELQQKYDKIESEIRIEFSESRQKLTSDQKSQTTELASLQSKKETALKDAEILLRSKEREIQQELLKQKEALTTEQETALKTKLQDLSSSKTKLTDEVEKLQTFLHSEIERLSKDLQAEEDALRKKTEHHAEVAKKTLDSSQQSLATVSTEMLAISTTIKEVEATCKTLNDSLNQKDVVCPTCQRSGADKAILQSKLSEAEESRLSLVASLQQAELKKKKLQAEIQDVTEFLDELHSDSRDALAALRKIHEDTRTSVTTETSQKLTEARKPLTDIENSISKLTTDASSETAALLRRLDAEAETKIDELRRQAEQDREKTDSAYSKDIFILQESLKNLNTTLDELFAKEENALLMNPKRLRAVKQLDETKLQQTEALSILETTQKEIFSLEVSYGESISSEKKLRLSELKASIRSLDTQELEHKTTIDVQQKSFKDWESDEMARLSKERKALETKKKQLEFWKKAFSSSGIRLHYISTILPEFNRRFQKFSDELTDGNIRVWLELDGTALKFNAENLTKNSQLAMFSAGETALTSLIFLLASAEVLSAFEKFSSNLSVFDEVFDTLDHLNSLLVFDALHRLAKQKRVLLITHNELLKESELADEVIDMSEDSVSSS